MSARGRVIVLVGYEDPEHGDDALVLARNFAGVLRAGVLVVTVVPYPDHLMAPEDREATIRECAGKRLALATERLHGLDVETCGVLSDSVTGGLHEMIEREGAALAVVGSSRRGPIGRVLLGSTGSGLLAGAPCSVAVAPQGYAEAPGQGMLRIGVAIDGRPESRVALSSAIALAQRARATLTILTVVTQPAGVYGMAVDPATGKEFITVTEDAMARVLQEAVDEVPGELPVEHRLLKGSPAPAIADAAGDFDLLVVGSRGRGALRRALLGSVSAKLMRESPCAVLVVPRGVGDDPLGLAADGDDLPVDTTAPA